MSVHRNYSQSEKFIIKTFKTCSTPICYYCGKNLKRLPNKERTIDHKIPLDQGGETIYTNLTWACQKCNNEKAWRNEVEYKEYLLEKEEEQKKNEMEVEKTKTKKRKSKKRKPKKVVEVAEIEEVIDEIFEDIKSLEVIESEEVVETIEVSETEIIVPVHEEIHKIPDKTPTIKEIKKTNQKKLKYEKNKQKRKQQKFKKQVNEIIHDSNYYNIKKFNKKKPISRVDKLFKKL